MTCEFKARKHSLGRIVQALRYACSGIQSAWSEPGFRELCLLHSILLIVLCFFKAELAVKMLLLSASGLSILCELFNSAIEAAVDFTSLERHPLAKRAKDLAAAAQYFSLLLLGVLWLMAILA